MSRNEPVTGIILAGGKSSRFGSDKSFAKYGGKSFIKHSIEILTTVTSIILISSNNAEHKRWGYPVIGDKIHNIGPAGGMLSTLQYSSTEWNLIISSDLPLMNEHYLQYLSDNKTEALVTIGRDSYGTHHPLCGLYSKQIVPYLEACVVKQQYSLKAILSAIPSVNVVAPPTRSFFYSDTIFKNINTLQDYYQLLEEGDDLSDLN